MWPLSRYPDLIPRGEAFVSKWGVPSIFIGRFFGPLRASVPLAAGIFEMAYWPFQIANFVSALVWSAVLLLFGDVISLDHRWICEPDLSAAWNIARPSGVGRRRRGQARTSRCIGAETVIDIAAFKTNRCASPGGIRWTSHDVLP